MKVEGRVGAEGIAAERADQEGTSAGRGQETSGNRGNQEEPRAPGAHGEKQAGVVRDRASCSILAQTFAGCARRLVGCIQTLGAFVKV